MYMYMYVLYVLYMLTSCVRNPNIAQSWVNLWMASTKRRSMLCAGQSTDRANPCFAPNIYTVNVLCICTVYTHTCTCTCIYTYMKNHLHVHVYKH